MEQSIHRCCSFIWTWVQSARKFLASCSTFSGKIFNNLVQSAVNAGTQADENPNSSVLAETMNLLANGSCVYQFKVRSRHKVTKYLSDERTHGEINNKTFRCLVYVKNQLFEIELVKWKFKLKESIIDGFFILQYAKFRM